MSVHEETADWIRAARDEAIQEARRLVGLTPVFLDTETTGLDYGDQVIEVGVVDLGGRTVFESLVRPSVPICWEARRVHGLCEHDVESAPSWLTVQPRLLEALGDRPVCIYNASFDLGMLASSAQAAGVTWPGLTAVTCVMELAARWWGEWSEYHGDYRWVKLEVLLGALRLAPGQEHRAVADANACRQVLLALAAERLAAIPKRVAN